MLLKLINAIHHLYNVVQSIIMIESGYGSWFIYISEDKFWNNQEWTFSQ